MMMSLLYWAFTLSPPPLSLPAVMGTGGDIHPEHCKVEREGDKVILHPLEGECYINHTRITAPQKLSQGRLMIHG